MGRIDRQIYTVTLPDATTIKLAGGNVTLDESWAPYVQGSVTVPMPASLSAFDPRLSPAPRVTIVAQQDFTDADLTSAFSAQFGALTTAALTAAYGAGLTSAITAVRNRPWTAGVTRRQELRTFDLTIRHRERGPENTLVLTLSSDEALLQDFAPLLGPPFNDEGGFGAGVVPALMLSDVVAQVIALFGGTLVSTTVDRALTEYYDGPYGTGGVYGIPWQAGVSAWDFLAPLVQLAGGRLWCDENRGWHLESPMANNDSTVAVTATETMTDFTDTITRDGDWADAVLVKYKWVKVNGLAGSLTDYARSYAGPVSKTYVVEYDLGTRPNAFVPAYGAAANLFAQVNALGRTVPVAAVNDFAAVPGGTLTATLPDTTTLSGRIAAVTWNFQSREMRVSTRNMT